MTRKQSISLYFLLFSKVAVVFTYLSSNIVLYVYMLVASKPKPKEIVELMLADAFENGFLSGVALYGDLVVCWWGSGACV